MREPKFSDAWCFGKEFQANSKICRVCLANQPCQKKFLKTLGASQSERDKSVIATLGRTLGPSRRAINRSPLLDSPGNPTGL